MREQQINQLEASLPPLSSRLVSPQAINCVVIVADGIFEVALGGIEAGERDVDIPVLRRAVPQAEQIRASLIVTFGIHQRQSEIQFILIVAAVVLQRGAKICNRSLTISGLALCPPDLKQLRRKPPLAMVETRHQPRDRCKRNHRQEGKRNQYDWRIMSDAIDTFPVHGSDSIVSCCDAIGAQASGVT